MMFNRLKEVAERTAALYSSPEKWDSVFGPIGLYLTYPFRNADYYCTPINVSTFAGTGGDGVHFSVLHIADHAEDDSPIVMTFPLSHFKNVVVGSNLYEFLRLGCVTGYAALEKLGLKGEREQFLAGKPFVDYRKTWASHHEFSVSGPDEDRWLLQILTEEFALTPWENLEQRLVQLEHEYFPLLKFKSEA